MKVEVNMHENKFCAAFIANASKGWITSHNIEK